MKDNFVSNNLPPQTPGHGSWHLLRIQALSNGQSVLDKHSGRHCGSLYEFGPAHGSHKATLFPYTLQMLCAPHGSEWQGSVVVFVIGKQWMKASPM